MKYQAGTTHRNGRDLNDTAGYKIIVEPFMHFFTRKRLYYWCDWQEEWEKAQFAKSYYGLIKINDG